MKGYPIFRENKEKCTWSSFDAEVYFNGVSLQTHPPFVLNNILNWSQSICVNHKFPATFMVYGGV